VSITTEDFSNIGSGNLKIIYDPDVVNPTGVKKGTELGGTLDVNLANPGIILIGWFTFPGVTLTDGSVVFKIEFDKVRHGNSSVSFDETSGDTDCQFYDASSQKLNDEPFSSYYKSGSLSFLEHDSPVTTAPGLTADENEDIDVPVTVTNFNNIGAVSLRLEYDPAVLSYNSADNTGGFPGLIIYNPVPGTITVSGTSSHPDGYTLADGSAFFTLNFKYSGGTSNLNWFDDGASCEYAGPLSVYVLPDTPQESYYVDGFVGSSQTTPVIAVEEVTNPVTCNENGSISLAFTNVPDGIYSINYIGGSFSEIAVSSGTATISAPTGTYNDLQITVSGITSASGVNASLNDPHIPDAPLIETVTQPTCGEETGSAVLTGLPVGSWTINPGNITGSTNSFTLENLTEGTYNYTVTNEQDCTSPVSADIIINEQPETPPIPTINLDGVPTFCEGGSVTLTSSEAAAFRWSNGETTQSITVSASGTFTVTVNNTEGCEATSEAIEINVIESLQVGVSIAATTTSVCPGITVTFTATPVNGGNPAYQWYNGTTPVGTDQSIYTFIPENGDIITVEMTSTENCITGSPATSNAITMIVDESPKEPETECYEMATWNPDKCSWEVNGSQPEMPAPENCWDEFVFNQTTCQWENTGVAPVEPTPANCWDQFTFNTNICEWENIGKQPEKPNVECWEIATWNETTCIWNVAGSQPEQPVTESCWDEFVFNNTTCGWDNIGEKPVEPTLENCWDKFTFNTNTCAWVNTGSQPLKPKTECYETVNWDESICEWVISGTQPEQPAAENCWDDYIFNNSLCSWMNQGTQPVEPTPANSWDEFEFKTTSCSWENIGLKTNTNIYDTQDELTVMCYPNPFCEKTSVKYSLPEYGSVNIEVIGVLGNKIKLLSHQKQNANEYQIELDGTNIISGIYQVIMRFTNPYGDESVKTVRIIKR
jgi:hypothetical protein